MKSLLLPLFLCINIAIAMETDGPATIKLVNKHNYTIELPLSVATQSNFIKSYLEDFPEETSIPLVDFSREQLNFVASYLSAIAHSNRNEQINNLTSLNIYQLNDALNAVNFLDIKPKKPIVRVLTQRLLLSQNINEYLNQGKVAIDLPEEMIAKIRKEYVKHSSFSYFLARAQLIKNKENLPGTQQSLRAGLAMVTRVRYNPQGTKLAKVCENGNNNFLIVEDLENGSNKPLLGHTGKIYQITWSPCGTRLASTSKDRTIKIWDAATGACLESKIVAPSGNKITQLEWHPHNNSLAFSINNIIHILDLQTWHDDDSYDHDCVWGNIVEPEPSDLKWNPQGTELASSLQESAQRIDLRSKSTMRWSLPYRVYCLAWNPHDNKDIACGLDEGKIIISSVSTGGRKPNSEIAFDHKTNSPIWSIAWHPQQDLIASATSKYIKFWNPHSHKEQCSFRIDDLISKITWNPNGSELAVAAFNSVYYWNWHDKNFKKNLSHTMSLEQMCLQEAAYNNPENVDISAPQLQNTWNELHPDMQTALLQVIPYKKRFSSWLTHGFMNYVRNNIHLECNPHIDDGSPYS